MADFTVRSDSVDVEQIMRQIRARIREKRGADYTEAELRELATVKLEKFLDPQGVRSNLAAQFRQQQVPRPDIPKLVPEEVPIYGSHRAVLRSIRRLLNPILKLFVNPNPIIHAIHTLTVEQSRINEEFQVRFRQREEMDPLYYELVHNLVMEVTRMGIEVHNMKMRVESLASRLDFDERRGRSLESVVEYRPPSAARRPQVSAESAASGQAGPGSAAPGQPPSSGGGRPDSRGENGRPQSGRPRPDGPRVESANPLGATADGGRPDEEGERRRRRRRRRRRPGQTVADRQGPGGQAGAGGDDGAPDDPSDGPEDSRDNGDGAAASPSESRLRQGYGGAVEASAEPSSRGEAASGGEAPRATDVADGSTDRRRDSGQ